MLKAYLSSEAVIMFLIGGVSLPMLCRRPSFQRTFIFLHVLEHEIVHGLTSIVLGGSFITLTAGLGGGSAVSTKDNFIVRLAPYVFPLFSVSIIILTFFIIPKYRFPWVFLSGMFYVNYLYQTFRNVDGQPDIKESGGTLTYPPIGLSNMFVLFGVLSLLKSIRM